jgi:hypothetical protein
MRWLLFAVLLAGCHRSAQMHAHAGVSVTINAPAEECSKIHDQAERQVCLDAVEHQKQADQKH